MLGGFGFCPAFGDWVVENNAAEKVFSTEVEDEIDAGNFAGTNRDHMPH
ncbi:MAG: hypothetical protein U9Q81_16115 [Pseudomonadota bacterium]|nr:hypothetical protein [Pseudomonadota bacterium]